MPLPVPAIDARSYEELRDEALRRIPVHNPSWTNFNTSDPGVTLVELFAFMTENLLYRANQIPERNRRKFLALLGMPLQTASPARGIVTFSNERGPLATMTFGAGVELAAGPVTFRTDAGLDVLPIEARVYYKRRVSAADDVVAQYRQLYASFAEPGDATPSVELYETVPLPANGEGVDLGRETTDGSLWVALLLRPADRAAPEPVAQARAAIAGRVLNLGILPRVPSDTARLGPGPAVDATPHHLRYSIPSPSSGGTLPSNPRERLAAYRALEATESANVVLEPGIVQLVLPGEDALRLWDDLDPLESGVGGVPPPLEGSSLNERLITWIRVEAGSARPTAVQWAGINAAPVTQRVPVEAEVLPPGSGDPDQVVRLARRPVVPGSVRLSVTTAEGVRPWTEIDDLRRAGPEVPLPDPALPPGRVGHKPLEPHVFVLDAEAGELRFGDGDRGARPPRDAVLRASYDVSDGAAGNVQPGVISRAVGLPATVKVTNPIRTWGGADAESVEGGERRISAFLQHGERLVTARDFADIAKATPGVDVGRVEVLPAFHPGLGPNDPGDAPGAVTLMVLPRTDRFRPDAPLPDRFFLDAICRHLDPRRLVTTEVFLRGPAYVPIWVSVGIETLTDRSIAEIRESVKGALAAFLSPLAQPTTPDPRIVPPYAHAATGWPLRYPVRRVELDSFAGRVDGVRFVRDTLVARDDGTRVDRIDVTGLQLPRLAGISVVVGDPVPIAELQGAPSLPSEVLLSVPVTPETC